MSPQGSARPAESRLGGAAASRRLRAFALVAALGALPPGSPSEAIELSVEGPVVEDAQGPLTARRTPRVGEELFIWCRLTGQGAEVPGNVRFVFRVDGTVIRELRVAVPAGAPITIGEYWTPRTAGSYEVGCEVHPESRHADTTREDNVRKRTIEIASGTPGPAVALPVVPAPKRTTPPRPTTPAPGSAAGPPDPLVSPAAPVLKPAAPPPPAPTPPGPGAASPRGTASALPARPDLEITGATTVADPGCGPKEPIVTVRATVKNVGEAAFVPPGRATLVEATVKIANQTTLTGRTTVPRLAPGAAAEIEVVAKSRGTVPDAGGLRYSVVITVNSESKVPEVTLDNNGEYVKAVFPGC